MKKYKKMKDVKISKIPNKMHFEVQLKERMHVYESKRQYKRCRDKRITKQDMSY